MNTGQGHDNGLEVMIIGVMIIGQVIGAEVRGHDTGYGVMRRGQL